MSKFYDSDMYGVTQSVQFYVNPPVLAADATIAKFRFYTASKLVGCNIQSSVIGANGTSGVNLKTGTTSIGAAIVGTNAIMTVVDGTVTETNFSAGSDLSITSILATETGEFLVTLYYQERYS